MTDLSLPHPMPAASVPPSLLCDDIIIDDDIVPEAEEKQEFTGYPRAFIQQFQEFIGDHADEASTALMLVSLNNLPMMISGYGHRATEEAIQSLLFSLKGLLAGHGKAQLFRIQKDQLALLLASDDARIFETLPHLVAMHIKQFTHQSRYGMMHILSNNTLLAMPDGSVDVYDVLNDAYIALKNDIAVNHDCDMMVADANRSRQEMNMVNYITNAINDKQLCLAYQPIVSSTTGEISHYEALLRVVKEGDELATAGPLIPVAERMGLIDMIDELVLDMVTEELRANPDLRLAFNVSNLTTNSAIWLRKLEKISKSDPDVLSRMMVEITETAVHLDMRRTAYFVAAVQSYGAQVALDDFGSGYTSFRQLKSLSVDIIKIDGVFVKDLVNNHDNRLFIKTMLDFTNGFGLQTVAEFVENGETAKMLMELGVEYLQGYYFGFPDVRR